MSNSFGRRTSQNSAPAAPPPPVMSKFVKPAVAPAVPSAAPMDPVDAEIREWKKNRGSHFPVKLLALVASASFGIASIALPADVTEWAQWPLYALSAASLYVGFARKARKA